MTQPGPKAVPMGERIQPRPKRRKRRKFDHGEPIWRIDTRPMVFVFGFIALILLGPATAMRTHAVTINLPQHWSAPPDYAPPYVTVEIAPDGVIYVEGQETELKQLGSTVAGLIPEWTVVLLRPAADSPYEMTALAINQLRSQGVAADDICFDPEQLSEHRRFEKIAFIPAATVMETERWVAGDIPQIGLGCAQFYTPVV